MFPRAGLHFPLVALGFWLAVFAALSLFSLDLVCDSGCHQVSCRGRTVRPGSSVMMHPCASHVHLHWLASVPVLMPLGPLDRSPQGARHHSSENVFQSLACAFSVLWLLLASGLQSLRPLFLHVFLAASQKVSASFLQSWSLQSMSQLHDAPMGFPWTSSLPSLSPRSTFPRQEDTLKTPPGILES